MVVKGEKKGTETEVVEKEGGKEKEKQAKELKGNEEKSKDGGSLVSSAAADERSASTSGSEEEEEEAGEESPRPTKTRKGRPPKIDTSHGRSMSQLPELSRLSPIRI